MNNEETLKNNFKEFSSFGDANLGSEKGFNINENNILDSINEQEQAFKVSLKEMDEVIQKITITKKEDTRSKIASHFLISYFGIMILVFFYVPFNNVFVGMYPDSSITPLNITDMLLTVSGILSGPFGFIIGYCFKSSEKQK